MVVVARLRENASGYLMRELSTVDPAGAGPSQGAGAAVSFRAQSVLDLTAPAGNGGRDIPPRASAARTTSALPIHFPVRGSNHRPRYVAPGRAPALLPKGAITAKVGKDEQLKTLPNPFLMGIARPPKRVVRPRVTRKIPLALGHVVWRDKAGKTRDDVWKSHFIKTRPKSVEAWVMLVGGKLGKLPAARDIAAARLCVPVTDATPQAPTMLGAAMLKASFEPMRPYDLKGVGEVAGTAIVPKYARPAPAKYYKLDITRALKRLAAGEATFHGLALQTVPNRGVDDGWTTRIDITRDKPTYIELDVYAK